MTPLHAFLARVKEVESAESRTLIPRLVRLVELMEKEIEIYRRHCALPNKEHEMDILNALYKIRAESEELVSK